jgi:hypothetical protein
VVAGFFARQDVMSWDSIAAQTPGYINCSQKSRNRHSPETTSGPRKIKAQGAPRPVCGTAVKTDQTTLDAHLDTLRLSFVKEHCQPLAANAAKKSLNHLDYLAQLIEGEAMTRSACTPAAIRSFVARRNGTSSSPSETSPAISISS